MRRACLSQARLGRGGGDAGGQVGGEAEPDGSGAFEGELFEHGCDWNRICGKGRLICLMQVCVRSSVWAFEGEVWA